MEYIINTLAYFSLYNKKNENEIEVEIEEDNLKFENLSINDKSNIKYKKSESLLLKKSEGYKNTYNSSYIKK